MLTFLNASPIEYTRVRLTPGSGLGDSGEGLVAADTSFHGWAHPPGGDVLASPVCWAPRWVPVVPTCRTINGGRQPGGENEGARDSKNGQQDRMSDQADTVYCLQAQFIQVARKGWVRR